MRLDSVMPFPWLMTLELLKTQLFLRKIGKRMGMQEKRLGIHYSFGPTLDINTNPKILLLVIDLMDPLLIGS